MIPGVKNFDPYTSYNPLRSLRSLRKVARRIKTRALRANGTATAAMTRTIYKDGSTPTRLHWLGFLAGFVLGLLTFGCDDGDQERRIVQRHDVVSTAPADTRAVDNAD